MSDKKKAEELVLVEVSRPVRFRYDGKGRRKGDPPFEVPRSFYDKWRNHLSEVRAPDPAEPLPVVWDIDVEALQAAVDAEDHNELGKQLGPLVEKVPATKAERIEAAKALLAEHGDAEPGEDA